MTELSIVPVRRIGVVELLARFDRLESSRDCELP